MKECDSNLVRNAQMSVMRCASEADNRDRDASVASATIDQKDAWHHD